MISKFMNRNNRRENTIVFSAIVLFVLFIQFWVSIDSFTHDLYGRCDDAWYFMGGRSLIHGLLPYVDYTDVKGPILFVIYGLAYLLDSDSYLGVFWITIITYTITFFICYKIFRLYVEKNAALLLVFCMGFFYFNPNINSSTEAEAFTQPFIATALYCYLLIRRSLYDDKIRAQIVPSVVIGMCIAIPFLIKFTIGVMIAFVAIVMLLHLVFSKQFKQASYYILWVCAGFLLIAMPIWAYLLYRGCFGAYLYEAFVYTTQKVSIPIKELPIVYLKEWIKVVMTSKVIFVFAALSIWLVEKSRKDKLLLMICAFFFLSVSLHSDRGYYTNVCNIWCVYLLIFVYKLISSTIIAKKGPLTSRFARFFLLIAIPIGVVFWVAPWKRVNFFTKSEKRTEYYHCAQYIQQIKNPRILNYKCYEFGLGMLAEALPACKRYALPYGYSNNDILEQKICLQKSIPDFVIVEDVNADEVEKFGYVYLSNYTRFENTWNSHVNFRLYGRPNFKTNNAKIKVTNMDVLLKKKVKFLE